eukprot:scaffold4078_cov68-Phaeocystis_antarctica.AAC.3
MQGQAQCQSSQLGHRHVVWRKRCVSQGAEKLAQVSSNCDTYDRRSGASRRRIPSARCHVVTRNLHLTLHIVVTTVKRVTVDIC